MKRTFFTLLASASAALSAAAHDYASGAIKVDHPWARPTASERQPAAAYFTIENTGETPDRLVEARAPDGFADAVELHTVIQKDGIARMRPIGDGVVVAPGETVAFAPGGRHVMLFGLGAPLALDEAFTLTLVFEKAGEIEVEVYVEDGAPEDHGGHSGH